MTSSPLPPRTDPRIRVATPSDVPRIIELIRGLARYERAEHEAQMTPDQLQDALFSPQPAAFALVADATPDGPVVGYAIYFLSFSTWRGVHGIYLEDLYVEPEHRGTGLGKALLQTLARIATARGFARVEWSVLTWNTPSIDFYRQIGAQPLEEWQQMRLTDDALAAFAAAD